MDENESKAPETAPARESSTGYSASSIADGAIGEAGKAMDELRRMKPSSFFSFDRMYFPIVARYAFIVFCVLAVVGAGLGVLAGFVAMFTTGFLAGLGAMLAAVVGGVVGIVVMRFWFEFMLVAFKINENVQAMREGFEYASCGDDCECEDGEECGCGHHHGHDHGEADAEK